MNKQKQIEELAKIEGYDVTGMRNGYIIVFRQDMVASNIAPNYLTSHDSMQRVIDGLDDEMVEVYADEIWNAVGNGWAYKATPEQKAKAVLKALGKWSSDDSQEITTKEEK